MQQFWAIYTKRTFRMQETKIKPVFYLYSPLPTVLRKWLAKTQSVLIKGNLKTTMSRHAVVVYIIVIVNGFV